MHQHRGRATKECRKTDLSFLFATFRARRVRTGLSYATTFFRLAPFAPRRMENRVSLHGNRSMLRFLFLRFAGKLTLRRDQDLTAAGDAKRALQAGERLVREIPHQFDNSPAGIRA